MFRAPQPALRLIKEFLLDCHLELAVGKQLENPAAKSFRHRQRAADSYDSAEEYEYHRTRSRGKSDLDEDDAETTVASPLWTSTRHCKPCKFSATRIADASTRDRVLLNLCADFFRRGTSYTPVADSFFFSATVDGRNMFIQAQRRVGTSEQIANVELKLDYELFFRAEIFHNGAAQKAYPRGDPQSREEERKTKLSKAFLHSLTFKDHIQGTFGTSRKREGALMEHRKAILRLCSSFLHEAKP